MIHFFDYLSSIRMDLITTTLLFQTIISVVFFKIMRMLMKGGYKFSIQVFLDAERPRMMRSFPWERATGFTCRSIYKWTLNSWLKVILIIGFLFWLYSDFATVIVIKTSFSKHVFLHARLADYHSSNFLNLHVQIWGNRLGDEDKMSIRELRSLCLLTQL